MSEGFSDFRDIDDLPLIELRVFIVPFELFRCVRGPPVGGVGEVTFKITIGGGRHVEGRTVIVTAGVQVFRLFL